MPKINYANLANSGDFAAAARSIATRGTSLKKDVQHALVCGLEHMVRCGDYTSSVLPLLDAIKTAFGKNLHMAAVEWVLKFSWLASEDGKTFAKAHDKVMKVEEAKAKDWWATEREAKARPFDAQAAIAALFDKATAADAITAGTLDTFLDALTAKLQEQRPELAIDLFDKMRPERQNEVLTVLVNRFTTPATTPEVELEQAAA